jgi:uncharacterized protein (TIGR03792 family)
MSRRGVAGAAVKPSVPVLLPRVLIGTLALLLLLACHPILPAATAAPPPGGGLQATAVVEHLRLKVPTRWLSAWQEAEQGSWEPWLHSQPGFLRRDLFWDQEHQEGILLIHWASREQWKSIGPAELERVQQRFEDLARAAVERDGATMVGGETRSGGGNPFPLLFSGELMPFPASSLPRPPAPAP